MKRYTLALATLGTALVTAIALHAAGWFARPVVTPPAPDRGIVNKVDPLSTSAGMQYRQCQPRHWRYLMLQR